MTSTIRTRFAPSPTGDLHIGSARTALFAWLFARKHKGDFILRIEDTDQARSTETSTQAILTALEWLQLEADEPVYYQSKRLGRYQQIVNQLLEQGAAYRCTCSKARLDALRQAQLDRKEKPRYDGHCRDLYSTAPNDTPHVIRLRTPQTGDISFHDIIHGEIKTQNQELDDLIIVRSDGSPTFHLSVVIDDMDMNISHVIRGDDHLSNTPRQLHIWQALGHAPPIYAHLPMILGEGGKRLSKRDQATGVLQYQALGFLPDVLLNYLVRLGWSYGDQEIFSREEMIALFDLQDVNKAAATLSEDKLCWLNQQYLKMLPAEQLMPVVATQLNSLGIDTTLGPLLVDVAEQLKGRCKTLVELGEQCRPFYTAVKAYDESAWAKHMHPGILPALTAIQTALTQLEIWSPARIKTEIKTVAEAHQLKLGQIAQPLRLATMGRTESPSIEITLHLLGQQETSHRIAQLQQTANEYFKEVS